MFWGCFAWPEKGPCLFSEKKWGSINSQKYCEKVVPLIDSMVSMRTWLSVMQDNAPTAALARTMEDMSLWLIQPIFCPANLPDVNPIEAV
ncbi:Bgt-51498 [Blumeria graminis f. sp. tritici]|uniref:Bgt-51498 n=1 Tax=Blumeria graminis f. sp. tritici TaxID=62690 RepID=A0A9X9LB28_BLUGR|nr:Bgt-51498 [Blumeria graminis f. sp. tritici]